VVSALSGEWIVEVQSDEPFLWASTIDRWLERAIPLLESTTKIDVFISASELPAAHVEPPNFVKIIKSADDKLLWASRSKIPSCFGGRMATFFRHAGLYLWRRESLLRFAEIAPGPIEDSEDTNALRLLENEFWAQVILMPGTQGIDVPADLVAAERYVWDNRALIAEETGLQP
jgi:3-deoxy-manno-octulosonate cytidylyltransferase (CMP-KDO synthetase)